MEIVKNECTKMENFMASQRLLAILVIERNGVMYLVDLTELQNTFTQVDQ